jgi:hypothetical protein
VSEKFAKIYPYFNDNLEYLTKNLYDFAQLYPEIASELQIERDHKIYDPDLIWLINSFAFLDARTKYQIAQAQDLVPKRILESLCPELFSEAPQICVAQLDSGMKSGFIPTKTEGVCGNEKFTTVSSCELARCRINDVILNKTSLEIQLEFKDKIDLLTLYVPDLQLFAAILQGSREIKHEGELVGTVHFPKNFPNLVPMEKNPYSMMYGYSICPEAFQFIEFKLESHKLSNQCTLIIDIGFPISRKVDKNSLLLNCTAISNLHYETSEPIKLTSSSHEYPILHNKDIFAIERARVYQPKTGNFTEANWMQSSEDYAKYIILSGNFEDHVLIADLLCLSRIDRSKKLNFLQFGDIEVKLISFGSVGVTFTPNFSWSTMDLFNISNPLTDIWNLFSSVSNLYAFNTDGVAKMDISSSYKIINSIEAWRGAVPQYTLNIALKSKDRGFLMSLLWAKTVARLSLINSSINLQIKFQENIVFSCEV